jgi:hypothetical protein
MHSEDKLLESRTRAAHAKALLDDELLAGGFAALEARYIEAWRLTAPHDERAREKLYIAVNVIGKLKEHLGSIIANGKIADAELETLIQDKERKKRFGII